MRIAKCPLQIILLIKPEATSKREFLGVPKEAIVKPEDERPVKPQIRPEKKLEKKEADIEYLDIDSEDMDGDGSPDWDPAVGPGV
jgi:hypothetical protein